jgi:hypothetical protein
MVWHEKRLGLRLGAQETRASTISSSHIPSMLAFLADSAERGHVPVMLLSAG